jgi:hypothetical protein
MDRLLVTKQNKQTNKQKEEEEEEEGLRDLWCRALPGFFTTPPLSCLLKPSHTKTTQTSIPQNRLSN